MAMVLYYGKPHTLDINDNFTITKNIVFHRYTMGISMRQDKYVIDNASSYEEVVFNAIDLANEKMKVIHRAPITKAFIKEEFNGAHIQAIRDYIKSKNLDIIFTIS